MRTRKDQAPKHQAAATLLQSEFPTITPDTLMEAVRNYFRPATVQATPLPDELLTVRQFCEKTHISSATAWREIAAGRIPTVRVGQRGVRIPAAVLTRMVAQASPARPAPTDRRAYR